MTNETHNWSQIVEKLRRAVGLAPPTLDEADAAMASAGEIPLRDAQIKDMAQQAVEQGEVRPDLELDLGWLESEAEDSAIADSMLVLNRNKGESDEEIQRRLEELRRQALESGDNDEEDEQGGMEGDRNAP